MTIARKTMTGTMLVTAASLVCSHSTAAQRPASSEAHMSHAHPSAQQIAVPGSMRAEHEEIHKALERATQAPGRVGEAARAVAKVLQPHFEREEQIALPPLGLLAPLARGEFSREMLEVLPMTDSLRAELPRMLTEHTAIRRATARLEQVAREERDAPATHLAERLALHAKSEEELFYPAAVLVGEIVRARSSAGGAAGRGFGVD
jgi:hypothetical protein